MMQKNRTSAYALTLGNLHTIYEWFSLLCKKVDSTFVKSILRALAILIIIKKKEKEKNIGFQNNHN